MAIAVVLATVVLICVVVVVLARQGSVGRLSEERGHATPRRMSWSDQQDRAPSRCGATSQVRRPRRPPILPNARGEHAATRTMAARPPVIPRPTARARWSRRLATTPQSLVDALGLSAALMDEPSGEHHEREQLQEL